MLIKIEAYPENYYTAVPTTAVPLSVFKDLRTRWIAIHQIHEVTAMPDLKNDDGSVTKRCVIFTETEHHIGLDQTSAFRYIVHDMSAADLAKAINDLAA